MAWKPFAALIATLALAACALRPDPATKPAAQALATDRAAMPVALADNAVAALERDGRPFFYSVAGQGSAAPYRDGSRLAFEYDALEDRWHALPPLPGARGLVGVAAAGVGGRLYLVGGTWGDGSDRLARTALAFDPATRTYTSLPTPPLPVAHALIGVYAERYLVLVAGRAEGGTVSAVQMFDTEAEEWFPASQLPGPGRFGHAGGLVGDTLLVTGGRRAPGGTPVAGSWAGTINPDDPSVIDWEPVPDPPGAPLFAAAGGGVAASGWVVVAGGTASADLTPAEGAPARAAVHVFDLDSRQWIGEGRRRVATMAHRGLVSDGDQIYTLGGRGPGGVITGAVIPVALGPQPRG
ncbi:hypothetical protein CCR80_08415 [Rhodothalassium salexigens]|uniref:Kelch repeat-containing protein n=1 Tax=Rhodothalassium salexigens TaxID=1086 RepID=UPI001913225C|nr:hypothetical protein [Rhodothalassium salexigens]MBK5921054.1 hypothetical protein [Rhodothalassium salexigens]